MLIHRTIRFLQFFIVLLIVLLTLEALLLNSLGYERLLLLWQTYLNPTANLTDLQRRFPMPIFAFQAWFAVAAAVIWSLVLFALRNEVVWLKAYSNLLSALRESVNNTLRALRALPYFARVGLVFLLSGWLIADLYLAATLPIYYDEAWTYLIFTRYGVAEAATFYPMPNNHILLSILTCFTSAIKVFPTLQIRLVSIIASLVTAIIVFRWLEKVFLWRVALIGTALMLGNYAFLHYAVLARGYALQNLFFVLAAYSIAHLAQINTTKYRIFYALAIILGFWTLPSFVYPTVSLHILYIIVLWRSKKAIVQDSLAIAIGIWCCYFPVFIRNTIKNIVFNDVTASLPFAEFWSKLPFHIHDTTNFLLGTAITNYSYTTILLVAVLSVLLLAATIYYDKNKTKSHLFMGTAWVFISPALWLILHRVVPFERTWTYLSLPLALAILGVSIGIGEAAKKYFLFVDNIIIKNIITLIFTFCLFIIQLFIFTTQYPITHKEDYELRILATKLPTPHRKNLVIGSDFWWYITLTEYAVLTEATPLFSSVDTDFTSVSRPDIAILERTATPTALHQQYVADSSYVLVYRGERGDFFYRK